MIKGTINSDAFVIVDFMSNSNCEFYIKESEQIGYEEATVSLPEGGKIIKGIRNNQRVTVESEEIADFLFKKAKEFLPDAHSFNPRIRFYKYEGDERFNYHKDGIVEYDNLISKETFLIYLNTTEGGETAFKDFEVSIAPIQGKALVFKHELKHKGCKVEEGVKYVMRTDVMYEKD